MELRKKNWGYSQLGPLELMFWKKGAHVTSRVHVGAREEFLKRLKVCNSGWHILRILVKMNLRQKGLKL